MANHVGFKVAMKYLSRGDHIVLITVVIDLVSMPVVQNAPKAPQDFVLRMEEEGVVLSQDVTKVQEINFSAPPMVEASAVPLKGAKNPPLGVQTNALVMGAAGDVQLKTAINQLNLQQNFASSMVAGKSAQILDALKWREGVLSFVLAMGVGFVANLRVVPESQ